MNPLGTNFCDIWLQDLAQFEGCRLDHCRGPGKSHHLSPDSHITVRIFQIRHGSSAYGNVCEKSFVSIHDLKKESNSIPVSRYVELHHAPQMPLHAINEIPLSIFPSHAKQQHSYLNLRASRSDSRRHRMSSSRTVHGCVSSCVLSNIRASVNLVAS